MCDGYSKKKFLSHTIEKQHKECALLLKKIYYHLSQNQPTEILWNTYLKWMKWMGHVAPSQKLKAIADAYHFHLSFTRISLKEHNLLPQIHTQDKFWAPPCLDTVIFLENIRSAHNVGSILRTTEAMSLGSVVFGGMTPLPTHKQVQDTSMGTWNWIEWRKGGISNLPRPLIALETGRETIPLDEFHFPKSFTLALGNEEYGCSDALLREADCIVSIPLYGRKNSLNVANAFAIAAYTIRYHSKLST